MSTPRAKQETTICRGESDPLADASAVVVDIALSVRTTGRAERASAARSGYLAAVSARDAEEELVHSVNNLLGTIEIQSEVARSIGTAESMSQALEFIVQSARRTRDVLQRARGGSAPE